MVREGGTGPGGDEEMATFACAAGPARGPLGWAEALSPRVGPGVLPWVFGSSLVVRVSDELVGGEYSTGVHIESRGSCHFGGAARPPGVS